jgi:hypothetical protein
MTWKPEYEEARKAREAANPELRARRIQSAKDSYERRKEQRKEYMRAYYAANPEKFNRRTPELREKRNAARREKYAQDAEWREQHKASVREWAESNPEKKKAQRLRKYSLTPEQHAGMLDQQQGVCAICKTAPSGAKNFPMVDHCHTTGKVRGLLCANCNRGIGKFKDSPALLRAAIAYLLNHGSSGAI